MFQVFQTPETYRQSPSTVTAKCGHPPQIAMKCCNSVVLLGARTVKSRHRDRGLHIATLAAQRMWEDNPSLPTIIKPEETRMQSQAQIDEILRKTSEAKEIPGVVAIAASGNDV